MNKTTLSEIKHLIHKTKAKNEENTFAIKGQEVNNIIPSPYELSDILSPINTKLPITLKDKMDIDTENFLCRFHSDKKSSISQTDEEYLKKNEGTLTIKELSETLNIPTYVLYYWSKRNHYHPKNGNVHSSIPNELQKEILKHLNTMSIAEMSRTYNISYHILYYWIKKQGLTAKNTSEFPKPIQQEIREKCQNYTLKDLAQEYDLSEQTMRSRLKNIGCFSDGNGGFFIVNDLIHEEILSCYRKNGIIETAKRFHTTKTAIKSYLKKYNYPP